MGEMKVTKYVKKTWNDDNNRFCLLCGMELNNNSNNTLRRIFHLKQIDIFETDCIILS